MTTMFQPHPGVNARCTTCAGNSYVVIRGETTAIATVCDCVSVCPSCDDTGYIPEDESRNARLKPCVCGLLSTRIELFNRAYIPNRYAHCTLESYNTTVEQTPTIMGVSNFLNRYDPEDDNSMGFLLYGDVGRGKTHLMVATLRALIFKLGVSGRFVEFSLLLADLKASFEKRNDASMLVDPLYSVQVLAIDEMGKGRGSDWEKTVLDELISRRYNSLLTLLVTTNYKPGKSGGVSTPNLATNSKVPHLIDRVDTRVYSRLEQMCDFLPTTGPDFRKKNRNRR
jgi:DNA replication protein DnaC